MSTQNLSPDANLEARCAQEPIHIPGNIQPHGMLLALNQRTLLVEYASANIPQHFPITLPAILGQDIHLLFGNRETPPLTHALTSTLTGIRPALLGAAFSMNNESFDILAHQHQNLILLELEPSPKDPFQFRQIPYQLNAIASRLTTAQSPSALCQAVAQTIRSLTGFDKVMVYEFDDQWNGTVIAEDKAHDMEPYLGHRFPASDIPPQARELYRLNPTRITSDVNALPVPIVSATPKPLDLTYAALRSVSPVHIQYLKNMHVAASMSVSILRDGKLWGLIACHHRQPLYMPHHLRLACQWLGEMFALQLAEKKTEQERRHHNASQSALLEIVRGLKATPRLPAELKEHCGELLELIDCDGVVVSMNDVVVSEGQTPSRQEFRSLAQWFHTHVRQGLFHTDWLPGVYPRAEGFRESAAGVLAISLSAVRSDYLMWFRREQIQTVKWAGDPAHAHLDDGIRLHPRKSFDVWVQQVGMKSRPWRPSEIEIAAALREALIDIFMRKAEIAAAGAKDHFIAVLSHELRTPLNPVLLAVSALESDRSLPPQAAELVTLIRRNVQIQTRLIDDLLDVTRISTGKLSLILNVVDLHAVLRHALEVCQHEVKEKNIALSLDLNAPHSHSNADTARMQQVFWNLLKNAIKFTPAGGTIRVSTANTQEGRLRIEVTDTGAGIAPELLPHIFNAYEQGGRATTARYGGLGLGLSISQNLVELHHGTILARSDGIGHGTTFTVELPVVAEQTPVMRTQPALSPGTKPQRLRILLVEDHAETARVMVKLLQQLGYEIKTADTSAKANTLAATEDFDLIISDLGLPDGSGVELIRELRKRSNIPAIALSGYGMEEDVRQCMDAGFDRHLVKPVDFRTLQEAIHQVAAR